MGASTKKTLISFIQKYQIIISLCLSFFSVFSLPYAMKLNANKLYLSNSIISIIIIYAIFRLILMAVKILTRRLFLYAYSLGWIFSMLVVSGTTVYFEGGFDYSLNSLTKGLILTTQLSFILAPVVALILHHIPFIREWARSLSINNNKLAIIMENERKYFFIVWAIIFIAWIPCFLAYFPGIFSYDSPWQINQSFTGQYNTHHPLLHTLYLYVCLKAGYLLGSYEIGAMIHSITQMLMLSAAFAFACRFMMKLKVPVIINIISVAYFALLPIHPIWAVNATKDVLFSAVVLLVFIFILEILIDPKNFFISYRLQLRFLLFVCLMCSLRNNGFYMFLLFIPFMVITLKRYRIRSLVLCIAIICVYQIFTSFLNNTLDVTKGNIGEALSIPIQQIARTVNYVGDQVSEEDKQIIFEIIPEEDIYKYAPYISDPVKEHFNQENFKRDPMKYLNLWVKLGIEFPGIYLDSFIYNTFGLWYPDIIGQFKHLSYSSYIIVVNIKSSEEVDIKQKTLFPAGLTFYNDVAVYSKYENIPVISMMFSTGFAFWILLFSASACIYYKQYQLVLPLVILFSLWLSLLLSPVILLRYVYPLFVCKPVIYALLFNNVESFQLQDH